MALSGNAPLYVGTWRREINSAGSEAIGGGFGDGCWRVEAHNTNDLAGCKAGRQARTSEGKLPHHMPVIMDRPFP